jgi:Two component regulator propeller.
MDFTTFRFSRDKADGLASDLVPAVFEDSRGVLWVGTSRGLQTFDPDNSSFHLVDVNGAPETASPYVSDILEFKTGSSRLKCGCDVLAGRLYPGHGDARHEGRPARTPGSNLPTAFMNRMFLDSAGRVWLAGETGGLTVVDGATLRRMDITIDEGIFVRSFAEDSATGNVLIGTMSGLFIYEAAAGRIRPSADPDARSCEAVSLLPTGEPTRRGEDLHRRHRVAGPACL